MLAVAIACAGASVHLAVDVAVALWRQGDRPQIHCPGDSRSAAASRPKGAVSQPAHLEAVAVRCLAEGAPRCDVDHAIDFGHAIGATATLFGDDIPEHAMLRFSQDHHRVVWTLRAPAAGLSADVDAFDGTVVGFRAHATHAP
jgi:hypothetical protein